MLQLAIECSGMHGSVAILDNSETVRSISLRTDRSSVQTLAEAIQTLVGSPGRPEFRSLDFLSVTNGPGSFTGLRGGLTTAKMLGLAWSLPIVAVDTLQVLAHQIVHRQANPNGIIAVPVINAYRRQVFTAAWLAETNETIVPLRDSCVVDADAWIQHPCDFFELTKLQPQALASTKSIRSIAVGGPGLVNYQPTEAAIELAGNQPSLRLPLILVENIDPEASWVGRVALKKFQEGRVESALSLTANYVRASAAEEKFKT